VGTPTTALNVAVALAMKGKSVILVEMRPSFGTLALHVNQQPANNLRTVLDLPPERIGQTELDSILCEGPARVWILFGPRENDAAFREIDPRHADVIISGLGQMAEYVILDLGCQPSAAMRAAVNLCHFAAVVTEREPGSVRAGKVLVKQLQEWGSRGNLQGGVFLVGSVIVNRTIYSNYIMPADEVQAQMGCEIVGMVPFGAPENLRALTESVPLVLLQPDNDTSISYVEIANRLSTDKLTGFRSGSSTSS
jgi:MinD-like ATPase involved in chromosome partitioning or flagellar assembly